MKTGSDSTMVRILLFSTDGYDWTIEEGQRVQGADPGVARLPDGSYIMIYTNIK